MHGGPAAGPAAAGAHAGHCPGIAWRTRPYPSKLAHNLAIVFWITANSYRMTSEFFGFDTVQVLPHVTDKHRALGPLLIGLAILALGLAHQPSCRLLPGA